MTAGLKRGPTQQDFADELAVKLDAAFDRRKLELKVDEDPLEVWLDGRLKLHAYFESKFKLDDEDLLILAEKEKP